MIKVTDSHELVSDIYTGVTCSLNQTNVTIPGDTHHYQQTSMVSFQSLSSEPILMATRLDQLVVGHVTHERTHTRAMGVVQSNNFVTDAKFDLIARENDKFELYPFGSAPVPTTKSVTSVTDEVTSVTSVTESVGNQNDEEASDEDHSGSDEAATKIKTTGVESHEVSSEEQFANETVKEVNATVTTRFSEVTPVNLTTISDSTTELSIGQSISTINGSEDLSTTISDTTITESRTDLTTEFDATTTSSTTGSNGAPTTISEVTTTGLATEATSSTTSGHEEVLSTNATATRTESTTEFSEMSTTPTTIGSDKVLTTILAAPIRDPNEIVEPRSTLEPPTSTEPNTEWVSNSTQFTEVVTESAEPESSTELATDEPLELSSSSTTTESITEPDATESTELTTESTTISQQTVTIDEKPSTKNVSINVDQTSTIQNSIAKVNKNSTDENLTSINSPWANPISNASQFTSRQFILGALGVGFAIFALIVFFSNSKGHSKTYNVRDAMPIELNAFDKAIKVVRDANGEYVAIDGEILRG